MKDQIKKIFNEDYIIYKKFFQTLNIKNYSLIY